MTDQCLFYCGNKFIPINGIINTNNGSFDENLEE